MNISKNGADFFEIKDGLKFERLRYFPMCGRVNLAMKYDVILGLGANIGRIRFNFVKLLNLLQKDARFSVIATSPILVNKAFGFCAQPDFLNAVIWLKSSKSANEILKIIHNYERIFGRKRSFLNAPRTLDLDILYYGGAHRNCARLHLPHSGVDERISVILPLGLM